MDTIRDMRDAQHPWAATAVRERLRVLKRTRKLLAQRSGELAAAVTPRGRTLADTLVAEVLPLLEACRFLEREAAWILRPRKLGKRGLPFWLSGIDSEVHREPMGVVLIVAPSNYPLFLPGVQVLQALAAGNAVLWKPGTGGRTVALLVAQALEDAGLPQGLLMVTDESVGVVNELLAAGVDKVFLTGSAHTGREVMTRLASTLTPCVMELSGCDAVFVLDDADMERVACALAFGLRLNGSATCMAPRRVFASTDAAGKLLPLLLQKLAAFAGVPLTANTRYLLDHLVADAKRKGATVMGGSSDAAPTLVLRATPEMLVMQTDIFAPVLAICAVASEADALAAYQECPYALTAAIFGKESRAREMAARIQAGTVLVNDVIAPTVDPRVPFGGRRQSGFGSTRGAEGLLEMTAAKTIQVRRNKDTRHYVATATQHGELFTGYIAAAHGAGLRQRWHGMQQAVKAAMKIGR